MWFEDGFEIFIGGLRFRGTYGMGASLFARARGAGAAVAMLLFEVVVEEGG